MNKKVCFLLVSLILLQVFAFSFVANAKTVIQWGDVKDYEYTSIHPFTYIWSGDVFSDISQGLNLKTLEFTKNKDEMDLVFNRYGQMASHGVVEIKQELEADTDVDQYRTFSSTAELGEGKVYLIKTSDKGFAKIKVHKVTEEKVTFSFVLPGSSKAQETKQVVTQGTAAVTQAPAQGTTTASNQPATNTEVTEYVHNDSDFAIQMQIADNVAITNGVSQTLDVPPMLIKNQPMIPLRLISEAFNANYRWRPLFRKVVIQYELNTITFSLNKNFIKVNNKKFPVQGTAVMVDKNILVSLDLIEKVFGKQTEYSPENRTIQVFYGVTSQTASQETTKDVESSDNETNDNGEGIEFLYGKWSLWIPGGIVYTSDAINQYREYVPGVGGQTLEIKKNGTYIWKLFDETIKGEWSVDNDSIFIPKGDYGWEWHVTAYDFDDYKGIRVSTLGAWRDGKRIK